MTAALTESTVESATLEWLQDLGYSTLYGPDIAAGQLAAERTDAEYRDVVLQERLRRALHQLNPSLPPDALDSAFRQLINVDGQSLVTRNRALHRMLVDGVTVEYRRPDGSIAGAQARVLDFQDPSNNDWLAVNQFTVAEPAAGRSPTPRRPDVVLFVNGLPLAVIELKNPADENATIRTAHNQLTTYQAEIPSLFTYNAALMVSDGLEARMGALGAGWEWFKPWRTIAGDQDAPATMTQLQVVLEGAFQPRRFLDLVRYFIVFEDAGGGRLTKKMAGYHQFHAVGVAVDSTLRAAQGDRRIGVIWHTQGSGKSLTMAFFTGRLVLHPDMANPTVVVLTDRNDLDDQLFGTFSRCHDLLRQPPVQAADRADLRRKLSVGSGGVVFTTIQKFFPEEKGDQFPVLSDRSNIVVIADEAHRSQYDFIRGYARHMRDALPHASFVGFTGTPIELADKNTRAVFGDYISIYDIQQAVADEATVPIYYESRLAKLELSAEELPHIDPDFEEVTEGEEIERKEKLKRKWAQLEAIVGASRRIKCVAADLVKHFEARLEVMDGKGMVVCMSRRICVEVYNEIAALRPAWVSEEDGEGKVKVIMTGAASDPPEWQGHIRNKPRREALANRFRDPSDRFNLVIVRDMWLTGFDAPSLHTMYLDKPMRGHGLMQSIARVNRVFKDKPGGLAVDYIGLADSLKQALATYTESGGLGKTAIDQDEAVAVMLEKHEICCGLFHGFDWSAWTSGSSTAMVSLLPAAQEHILQQPNGRERLLATVTELSQAFALAVPDEEALRIRDDISFFQAVRSALAKKAPGDARSDEELDHAIRQIVSRAVVSDQVIDIFETAGLKKPDISILSDEFLEEVRGVRQRNVAVDLLRRLLAGELHTQSRKNLVLSRTFAQRLEETIRRYQNRAVEAAQVIEELIALAKDLREASRRGESLGLTDEELAFYDALETNDSAVQVLGDETLREIARQLVKTVRSNVSIDWTVKETVRANLRVQVKRTLRRFGYPPDKQEKATQTVVEQAEILCPGWVVD